MKTSAKIIVQNNEFKVNFDVFEAVWGYLLYDNISLLADSRNNNLKLYSFISGKEQTSADISKDNMDKLSNSSLIELNYSLGDDYSVVYKKEAIDVTGKFIEAIEAQFNGKNKTAIECFRTAIEANPNVYRLYGLLGRCLRAEGIIDEAINCYNRAIELAPNSPEAYCNLGVLFQKEGEEEKAQEAFVKAIELDNFYCNALVRRADWLLKNDSDSKELNLCNLKLSAVYTDVTSAQNYLKKYLEVTGLDRTAYLDKETEIFGNFAEYKLQKKLKIIESCINNGAFGATLKYIKEILEATKESFAKNIVAGWCRSRAVRSVERLKDFGEKNISEEFNKIIASIPAQNEEELSKLLQESNKERTERKENFKPIKPVEKKKVLDREALEAASREAIAKIENKVSENGDYAQPIACLEKKEMSDEAKEEALAEQELLAVDEDFLKPTRNNKNNDDALLTEYDDIPAPKPVLDFSKSNDKISTKSTDEIKSDDTSKTEDLLAAGVDDIPAPKPVIIDSKKQNSVNSEMKITEPILKPKSTAELLEDSKKTSLPVEKQPSIKPKSTAELMKEAKNVDLPPSPVLGNKVTNENKPMIEAKSTAELMAEAKNVNTKPNPVLKVNTKGVDLNVNYKSPVKDVNPLTVQEFFMIVLFEVMRDGDIEAPEKKFLSELKNKLNISGKDYSKMYYHIQEQIKVEGAEKPKEGKFNPKRVFKNICKAAWRDGALADSEKKILLYARKIFNISEQEFKDYLNEAKEQVLGEKNNK